ncbi:hypothetical protein RZ760_015105 [Providencia rettgeri]|nr:hypothetical protein [Providencia rettgeri]
MLIADQVRVETPEASATIMLDPDHGGKDIVLDIAKQTQSDLKKSHHINALLTRNNDVFVDLKKDSNWSINITTHYSCQYMLMASRIPLFMVHLYFIYH